ncbi:MAG: hypothetical protein J7J29_00025 [Psychrobacter sp.]|jgi:hypothetical protein|uniref:DUF4878 domain-containing protein n=1 Tax=Psychrobacter namhaensis TaxID=292734 RepID=A0ABW8LF68_9GAMM|nr:MULTISPECIES: hypothetical protein [Psychrobacter]MCD1280418.1 hypothetical protein [Psychrobacter sp. CCUG 69069]MCD6250688.1 hypothetical protein [Psychrobacter sp.]HCN17197.1 hypothetical protein [Psychrobacter sp.]
MTTKPLSLPRLPIILATGVLSTGLLLSGCSNNDTVEPEVDTENTAAVTANNTDNQAPVVSADNTVENETIADPVTDEAIIDNDDLSPVASSTEQKSLVTNPTQSGTPEDTVKQALDSLYYGDAKKAAEYYKVDMANFEEELAKTQSAFRQTVDGVTITDTKYNDDKTRATIVGELMLKGQSEPAPLTYELQKIAGQWKILG